MALKFFGFTFGREDDSDDREQIKRKNLEKQAVSFVPPTSDDGSTAIAAGGYYGQYLDLEGDAAKTDVDLIRKYRIAAEQPECDMAIENITNESIIHEYNENPVDLNLEIFATNLKGRIVN